MVCANVSKSDPSASCKVEDLKVIIQKRVERGEASYSFERVEGIPFIVYRVKFKKPEEYVERLPSVGTGGIQVPGAGETSASGSSAKMVLRFLKQAGGKFGLTVEMPGEITGVKGGVVEDNAAVFDLVDVIENNKRMEVDSRELNFLGTGLAVAVGVAVVVVAWLFVRLRRARRVVEAG